MSSVCKTKNILPTVSLAALLADFKDGISLYNLGCSQIHHPPASASLLVCTIITPGLAFPGRSVSWFFFFPPVTVIDSTDKKQLKGKMVHSGSPFGQGHCCSRSLK